MKRLLRQRPLCLVAMSAMLLAEGTARAAVYVVNQNAPGAADTNAGTEDSPFMMIQRAADLVKPGDTVYVMTGRYDERVRLKSSGEEGQPITFQAMPRRSAVVQGFDLPVSYIRIVGFDITSDTPATAVQLGSYCEVLDNYIHDMMVGVNGTAGKVMPDGSRDYSPVSHNRIAYNKVYHREYGFMLGGNGWMVENNKEARPSAPARVVRRSALSNGPTSITWTRAIPPRRTIQRGVTLPFRSRPPRRRAP